MFPEFSILKSCFYFLPFCPEHNLLRLPVHHHGHRRREVRREPKEKLFLGKACEIESRTYLLPVSRKFKSLWHGGRKKSIFHPRCQTSIAPPSCLAGGRKKRCLLATLCHKSATLRKRTKERRDVSSFFLRESQSSSTPNMGPSSPPLAPKATRHILTLYGRASALSLSQQYRKSPIFAEKFIVLGNKFDMRKHFFYFPRFDKPFSAFPILFPPAKKGGKSKRETV